MKKFFAVAIVLVLAYGYLQDQGLLTTGAFTAPGQESRLQTAIANRQSDVQVTGEGTVTRILRDDLDGSRHQKFILRLESGDTLLVSHNIDLAPRINNLKSGDRVEFHGEYEWNPKGGVIHWTHHDPAGRHVGGWLKHENRTYQ